jgi:hypothetical protein
MFISPYNYFTIYSRLKLENLTLKESQHSYITRIEGVKTN